MTILVTGNMGYVGPLVLRRLRESHPQARLIGYDMGYFAHCLTGAPRLPESLLDHHVSGISDIFLNRSCKESTLSYISVPSQTILWAPLLKKLPSI
jgi:hypothetical protein